MNFNTYSLFSEVRFGKRDSASEDAGDKLIWELRDID